MTLFDHWGTLALVALFSLPLYWFIGRIFFDDWQDFLEHLRLWFQPFWLSALRGEYHADMWAQVKLFVYLLICGGWVFGISSLLA
jgi:hypothetical protein